MKDLVNKTLSIGDKVAFTVPYDNHGCKLATGIIEKIEFDVVAFVRNNVTGRQITRSENQLVKV